MSQPADLVVAVDTSVALPFILRAHEHHARVTAALSGRRARLTGQSLAETYAVLTRLPGDGRVAPADAAQLIEANFGDPLCLADATVSALHRTLSRLRISGGATYDALVGMTAREHGLSLISRDTRALGTYGLVGVNVEVIG